MLIRTLEDVGNVALFISFIGIAVWVIQYSMLAKWWKNFIGITLVGEAVAIFLIYLPSVMGLIDPARFEMFAQTRWYLWLSFFIVTGTATFIVTRIVTWEMIRRQRPAALQGDDVANELQHSKSAEQ